MENQTFTYDNKIVRLFMNATIIWGIVGVLVGLLIALQLPFPEMNFKLSFLTYGRIRPIHTNAIVFAFVGNAIFTGVYYSMQRLLKARMFSDVLSKLHFWGWQLIIVAAAVTLALGYTMSKEYAELEWPIDIAIAIVWVAFGINITGTMIKRRTKHIYVAIWFYIATWTAIALLHVVNSIEIPVSFFKSYPVYAGVQDAVVQWWYGHNAVAFFLTTPFLGLMYYFLPKAANRPVYSYKLSIVHFWSLIFIYMWAGPHHLLYQALPGWAQTLGVVFSVMLIAPSWGGMVNGLLTLRSIWDKVREEPILKFYVVAVTAYGMATFEGPMLSLKNVNAISHFTDWTPAHTHIGGMGWNGLLTFGMLYWLVPRLYNVELFSKKMANTHFWIATIGMLFWAIPMYWAGITQSLMWKEFNEDGMLAYPNFLETVTQIVPMYITRAFGGSLYVIGFLMMIYNLYKTMAIGKYIGDETTSAPALHVASEKRVAGETIHSWLERKPVQFTIWAVIAVAIGGAVEIIPMITIKSNIPTIETVTPYSPLELQGRDIYVREGCYNCHSQQVRPFRSEVERYGDYSKVGEFVYDHPFQWGSKRTGPDLARTGDINSKMYKSGSWHFNHMMDPTSTSPGSLMPSYPWLYDSKIDNGSLERKIEVMQFLGVPYPEGFAKQALADLQDQAAKVAADIPGANPDSEIIALIAYMHKVGSGISVKNQ
jgi:cytochrome c oxidase cbb3-type subunit I/II